MQEIHQVISTPLTDMLKIRYPIIMAPMFLVSNTRMVIEASHCGITGSIPALNYRDDKQFRAALEELKSECSGPFGINLIANKSNVRLKEQLHTCLEYQVDYIITSLGNPKTIIEESHKKDMLVFCDVIDDGYAKKVESLGADALIAVNSDAGGHAGNLKAEQLIPLLKSSCHIPVISAGGVGNGEGLRKMLDLGACGISMGSPFIATEESPVSEDYKKACVEYNADDIVMSTKLSGTPCTVINTPYVQKTGTQQNAVERMLNKNRSLKKFVKMLTFYKGMKSLEKAAFSTTYKTVWCAGPSIQYVSSVRPVKEVIGTLIEEYYNHIAT
ncbi:MAG: nitronate monooxygenase [Cyclobacteriaceae bacterium]|nr:nitronate monooxygenase [Cyclobacteriaceae bacterium]